MTIVFSPERKARMRQARWGDLPSPVDTCPRCGGPKARIYGQCGTCRRGVSLEIRFWPKVDRSGGPDACWPWLGRRDKLGYGGIHLGGYGKAHRIAYRSVHGEIPPGLEIDHLCRNPSCVNPAHLEAVTHRENLRRSPIMGPSWRMDAATRRAVVDLRLAGTPPRIVARHFGIHESTVRHLVRRLAAAIEGPEGGAAA